MNRRNELYQSSLLSREIRKHDQKDKLFITKTPASLKNAAAREQRREGARPSAELSGKTVAELTRLTGMPTSLFGAAANSIAG
jgi:hypothetical protein